MIEGLTLLFKEKPKHIHLFRGFESFVKKEKDKKVFHAACDQLAAKVAQKDQQRQKIGQTPRYSKSEEDVFMNGNQILSTEPASKKQKISVESKNIELARKAMPVAEFFPTLSDDDSEVEVP